MSIAGASASICKLLKDEFLARYGTSLGAIVASSTDMDALADQVTIFPYKIEVDPTRRHVVVPSSGLGSPARVAMALDMRFLLTVWPGTDVELQLEKLERCMGILDEHAILTEDRLDTAYTWAEGTALRMSLEPLTVEDLLRIWDGLNTKYQLSVPYVVRTIRTGEREQSQGADVRSSIFEVGQKGR